MNPLLDIAGALLKAGAPLVGGLLQTAATAAGGPVAGAAAGLVIGALAEALGLPAGSRAQDVAAKMQADPAAAAAAAAKVEATHGEASADLAAQLADVQDARSMQETIVASGSGIQWSPTIVSVIVLVGFSAMSYMSINAKPGSSEREVILFLLGAWLSLATTAVTFWLGSSSSSKGKDETLATMSRAAVATAKKR